MAGKRERKKNRKFYQKKRYYALAILAVLIGFIYQFSKFRTSDASYRYFFENQGYENFAVDTIQMDGRKVRYVVAGDTNLPLLMMIHGTPASSTFWQGFFKDSTLRANFRMAAIDRPGYGYSGFGKLITDLKWQSDALERVFKKIDHPDNKKVQILASSYGGSVAAKYAMDHPNEVDGIIFQSSSLLPGIEKTYRFSYITRGDWISWILPTTIRMANTEKLGHAKELQKIQNGWPNITSHVVFLHGDADGLVYPENAKVAYDNCCNAKSRKLVMFEDRGHDLYWTRRNDLITQLLDLKEKVASTDFEEEEFLFVSSDQ